MKGMRKVKRGAGFRGVLNYTMERDNARILAGNMTGQTPRELSAEFAQSRQLRQDIKKPVWHQALSLPPGEKISDERWQAIAEDYMHRMGFTDLNQWVAIQHTDRDHQHIHLIVSRVGLDGRIWYGRDENLITSRVTQELEKDYGLTITRGSDEPSLLKTRTNGPEMAMWERKGQQPPKERLAEVIEAALAKARTPEEYINTLKQSLEPQGFEVRVNQASTGKLNGVSFAIEIDGKLHKYQSNEVHRKYSWQKVEKILNERSNHATQSHFSSARRIPPACRRNSLQHLSQLPVVRFGERGEMLLPANVSHHVGDFRTERDSGLRWGNSVAPIDPHKQAYKARLLENHYQSEVRDVLRMSLNSINFPGAAGEPLAIKLRGGGQVTDLGDRLTCKSGDEAEIKAMVELARLKGWQQVNLTGKPEFQRRAAEAYRAAGVQVVGQEGKLPVTKEQQIHDALARLAEAKAQERKAQERIEQQSQTKEGSKKWNNRPQH